MNFNYWGVFFFCFLVPFCFLALMGLLYYEERIEKIKELKTNV